MDDDGKNAQLYGAIMKGEKRRVVDLCGELKDGPLHVLTIHNDTVLHTAAYSKQDELVSDLLDLVKVKFPNCYATKITHENGVGNAILHEAATSKKLKTAAAKMLEMEPSLLTKRNKYGETPLFHAVRYGKSKMFLFLNEKVRDLFKNNEKDCKSIYRKRDKSSTILHTAVVAEHFDLAIQIAMMYPYLIHKRDRDGMTALQLLSCNASAFRCRDIKFLKRLIYACVSADSQAEEQGWRVPFWEAIRKEKGKYERAVKLANVLVKEDKSWKDTKVAEEENIKIHSFGKQRSSSDSGKKIPQTPLLLATKSGCVDIVEKILDLYPQAVEHIDSKKRSILHVAIKYRRMEIFDRVEKMEIPMKRLIQKCDQQSNSILHMVGKEGEKRLIERKKQSPALQLRNNLLLFERIQKLCSDNFFKHINSEGQTAEELFAKNNEQLCIAAQDWLKRTAENYSIVAVLIATVAFAAAYTIPGGSKQETGVPVFLNRPFFAIFTISDVISFTFTLTSIIVFLSILTSPFGLEDFKHSLPQKLMLGVTFLIFSVTLMMVAFAATIILMINNKEQWTKIAMYTVAFLPVTVFAISYLPLYISLMETFKYTLNKIGLFFPRYNSGGRFQSWVTNLLNSPKSENNLVSSDRTEMNAICSTINIPIGS